MKAVVDSEGRLHIPDELQRLVGLEPGSHVEIRAVDGRLEVEPASRVHLEERDGWLVAVADGDVEPATVEEVNRVLSQVRGHSFDDAE